MDFYSEIKLTNETLLPHRELLIVNKSEQNRTRSGFFTSRLDKLVWTGTVALVRESSVKGHTVSVCDLKEKLKTSRE